jgi:hypothetical protein
MKAIITSALASIAMIAGIFACNLPGTPKPLSVDDQAATAIEATLMEGRRNGADVPITATFSLTPNLIVSATPTLAATGTITPTYSVPMLTVREQTNCRAGPGQDYEVVFTYLPNAKLEIIGNYGIENYWLVKSEESPTGNCWLWGEFVEVTGSFWVVPSITPPPTATKPPPNAPSFQSWDYLCEFNGVNLDLTVSLKWSDKSNNETGFRLYRNGELVIDLPANSTSYVDKFAVNSGQTVSYRLEAYNPTGVESDTTSSFGCS